MHTFKKDSLISSLSHSKIIISPAHWQFMHFKILLPSLTSLLIPCRASVCPAVCSKHPPAKLWYEWWKLVAIADEVEHKFSQMATKTSACHAASDLFSQPDVHMISASVILLCDTLYLPMVNLSAWIYLCLVIPLYSDEADCIVEHLIVVTQGCQDNCCTPPIIFILPGKENVVVL